MAQIYSDFPFLQIIYMASFLSTRAKKSCTQVRDFYFLPLTSSLISQFPREFDSKTVAKFKNICYNLPYVYGSIATNKIIEKEAKKMKDQRKTYIKNILIPCFLFSAVTGILTGSLILLFKIASSKIMGLSKDIYGFVRENPVYLPVIILAAAIIGLTASFILKHAKDCRGGGIPTAVASIRGLIPLKWMQGIFVLFGSSMLTYLCGIPLGNEGPSVQMGTAIGKGTTQISAKKNRAWERYVMTGGACAGFAAATGAPLTGIMFALEEAHRRFSPMIFMVATVSVLTGTVTHNLLSELFGLDTELFDFAVSEALPLKYLWIPIIIGAACGFCAILFTKLYRFVRNLREKSSKRIPFFVKITAIFSVTALLAFLCEDFVGSGHSLIDKIIHGEAIWYVLIAAIAVRALLMIFANSEGVSGGIFIPTLTFGAIIAALLSSVMISAGMIGEEYYTLLIAIGMSSFLSASSRTPITALMFSAEALCGVHNILPVGIGVIVSYLIIETSGITAFNDTVIEAKAEEAHKGKTPIIVNTHMTVQPDSFAVGKEIRDILWPPTCVVLSVDKNNSTISQNFSGICVGDVLHIHYQTYEPERTTEVLMHILGEQPEDPRTKTHFGNEKHVIPSD